MSTHADPRWARAVVEGNHRWLHALFLSATGDPLASDDLVQQTFLVAMRTQDRYRPETPFGAWLRGIARNLLREHWRSRKVVALDDLALERIEVAAAAASEPEDPTVDDDRKRALAGCLGRLGERARRLVELKYQDGRDSNAIAELLAMSRAAVDVAVCRARQALRTCIDLHVGGVP